MFSAPTGSHSKANIHAERAREKESESERKKEQRRESKSESSPVQTLAWSWLRRLAQFRPLSFAFLLVFCTLFTQ